MHRMLKSIKSGGYAVVIEPDKDGNIKTVQLRYNPLRHKFFLSEDKRGLMRRSITSKVALKMINHTLAITQSNENECSTSNEMEEGTKDLLL